MVLKIYTDGAARGNPGRGGYGALLMWGSKVKELAEGFRLTTNNRMELLGIIKAIEALTKNHVTIEVYSDSKYVVDSINNGWVYGWAKKGFKDKKNPDLWQQLLKLMSRHDIRFFWVKGHANNPYNNRCDELATAAADGKDLLVDEVYEQLYYNM